MTSSTDPIRPEMWPRPPEPPPQLTDAICRECTRGLSPQKRRNPWKRTWASIALSAVMFGVLLTIGWYRHPPKAAVFWTLVGAAGWGALQAGVLLLGHGRPPGRRISRWIRWGLTAAVLGVFLVHLTAISTSALSFGEFLSAPRSLRSTVVCGIHALLFGALASGTLFFLWRRSDPFSPGLTGALTGLSGGLVGAIALDLTCSNMEAWHLWLGHGSTLLLLVIGGWFAGRRWLCP